jgi:hypothetical protein
MLGFFFLLSSQNNISLYLVFTVFVFFFYLGNPNFDCSMR